MNDCGLCKLYKQEIAKLKTLHVETLKAMMKSLASLTQALALLKRGGGGGADSGGGETG